MSREEEIQQLDELYVKVDKLFSEKDYEAVNAIIDDFAKNSTSALLCVGLLTVTHQYNTKLKDLTELIEHTKFLYRKKGATEAQVAAGVHGFGKPFNGPFLVFK